jgi:hypothetical protein
MHRALAIVDKPYRLAGAKIDRASWSSFNAGLTPSRGFCVLFGVVFEN